MYCIKSKRTMYLANGVLDPGRSLEFSDIKTY